MANSRFRLCCLCVFFFGFGRASKRTVIVDVPASILSFSIPLFATFRPANQVVVSPRFKSRSDPLELILFSSDQEVADSLGCQVGCAVVVYCAEINKNNKTRGPVSCRGWRGERGVINANVVARCHCICFLVVGLAGKKRLSQSLPRVGFVERLDGRSGDGPIHHM